MLFDLRGRGRRRTVQVIYIGLALLFGVGFVGLGVGVGGGGGGILNAFTGESGAPKASFAGQVKKYQKLVAKQPKDLSAWEGLINAQLHEAGGESSDQQRQTDEQGQRTVLRRGAVLEQLSRAESAKAQSQTGQGNGAGVR